VDKVVCNWFADFKKAFDLVRHDGLWAVLRLYGIKNKLVTILMKIYMEATAAVLADGETTEWFKVTVGNRQAFIIWKE